MKLAGAEQTAEQVIVETRPANHVTVNSSGKGRVITQIAQKTSYTFEKAQQRDEDNSSEDDCNEEFAYPEVEIAPQTLDDILQVYTSTVSGHLHVISFLSTKSANIGKGTWQRILI